MTKPPEHTRYRDAILRTRMAILRYDDALRQARACMDTREIIMLESLLQHRHAYLTELLAPEPSR